MAKRDFLSHIDLNLNQMLNVLLQNLSTEPSTNPSTRVGQVIFNTTLGKPRYFDGTNWKYFGQTLLEQYGIPTAGQILVGNAGGTDFAEVVVSGDGTLASTGVLSIAKATNLKGGNATTLLGSIPYQSNSDTTSLLSPNTTATRKFLRQVGDGTNGAAPAWDTITKTDVGLSAVENTALSTWAGTSNITTLGTITTGVWSGTIIGLSKGGSNADLSAGATGGIVYKAASALGITAAGTQNQLLISNAAGAPTWATPDLTYFPSAFVKHYVKAATTVQTTLSGPQTIDGISLVAGDRVLVIAQTLPQENGIYVVAAGAWSRATDANTSALISGTLVSVAQGTANGGLIYVNKFKATDILGTTVMPWYINVNSSVTTLSSLVSIGTITTGTWNASIIAANYGGTGVANAASSTITLGGALSFLGAFTTAFTVTGNTTITLPTSGTLYGTATGSISSAQLLNSLSDETGTGNVVFNTTPTFITSILTSSTTFALLNTTATTINAFGAATTLNIGNAAGITNLAGALVVGGNLTVNGTLTAINSNVLTVDDKNIELASVVSIAGVTATLATGTAIVTVTSTAGMIPGQTLTVTGGTGAFGASALILTVDSPTQFTANINHATAGAVTFTVGGATDDTANGGGITLKGTTDKTFNWIKNIGWTPSEDLNLVTGKVFKINNVSVLSATDLGTSVVNSSLTKVGTISTGVWQGTTIAVGYGGTGFTSGYIARKVTGTVATGTASNGGATTLSTTTFTVVHGLTAGVVVQIYETTSGQVVESEIVTASAGTTVINFNVAPTSGFYSFIIVG